MRGFNKLAPSDPAVAGSAAAIVKTLADRLGVNAYLLGRSELLERKIERPVFVFGSARTGTTLLNNLLAADPARRSPLAWEMRQRFERYLSEYDIEPEG